MTEEPFDKLSPDAKLLAEVLFLRYHNNNETTTTLDDVVGLRHFGDRKKVIKLFGELVARDFVTVIDHGNNPTIQINDTKFQSLYDDGDVTVAEAFEPPPTDLVDDDDEWAEDYGGICDNCDEPGTEENPVVQRTVSGIESAVHSDGCERWGSRFTR